MRLQDTLENLSESTRQAILKEQSRRFDWTDNQELLARLSDPVFIHHVWERSSELERQVIRLFVQTATRGFFSRKDWEKNTAGEHRPLQAALTKLRRLGLVVTVRKMWSEIGYLMPQEIRDQFTTYLLPDSDSAHITLSKTLPYYITAGRGIQLDLIGLLLAIRDQEIPLTQKGSVHRRYQQKLTASLSLGSEHVNGLDIPILHEEGQTGRALLVVLDLAWKLGLVRESDRRLVLDQIRVKQWLNAEPASRWKEMYQIVHDLYVPTGKWWDTLTYIMGKVPVDQWCSLDEQLRMLERAGFVITEDAVDRITKEWLHLLLGFGWIQLGVDEEKHVYWRWNAISRAAEEEGWYVDPAGVITIPPLVPIKAIWEASRYCSLQFDGTLIRGDLQEKKLQSYLASGGSEAQVLSFLQDYCVHPLPDSIGELIRLWAQSARQIQLEPCYRVRTAHAGFLTEWLELADFKPYLTQMISSTEFLVSREEYEELVALLRQYGYEPHVLATHTHPAEKHGSPQVEEARLGMVRVERPWDGYAVENTFPEQEGQAQISALPKVWTGHLQSYHPQSLRDLLKRAAELQLEVEYQLADQMKKRGKPAELRVEMGYWMVTFTGDSGKNKLRLEEIDRVRIVVPEYLYEGS